MLFSKLCETNRNQRVLNFGWLQVYRHNCAVAGVKQAQLVTSGPGDSAACATAGGDPVVLPNARLCSGGGWVEVC